MARCIGFDHTHTPHEFRSPGRSIETVAQQAFLPSQGLAAHPSTITWVLSVPLEPISSMSCINASAISPPHVLMVSPRHTFSFMTAPTSSADRPPVQHPWVQGSFWPSFHDSKSFSRGASRRGGAHVPSLQRSHFECQPDRSTRINVNRNNPCRGSDGMGL